MSIDEVASMERPPSGATYGFVHINVIAARPWTDGTNPALAALQDASPSFPDEWECSFLRVIQQAAGATSRCDYLHAVTLWEYARELPSIRSQDKLRSLVARRTDVDQHRLLPFLNPDAYGFPARSWRELSGEEHRLLVDTFCGAPVLVVHGDVDAAVTIPSGRAERATTSRSLVFDVQDYAWRRDGRRVLAAIGARCRREFGPLQRGEQRHRHGQTTRAWIAALHRLAFCRKRVSRGLEAAREYERQVRAAGGKTKFGSLNSVRREVIKRARNLFPWLPAGEIPIHAVGPNDAVAAR